MRVRQWKYAMTRTSCTFSLQTFIISRLKDSNLEEVVEGYLGLMTSLLSERRYVNVLSW